MTLSPMSQSNLAHFYCTALRLGNRTPHGDNGIGEPSAGPCRIQLLTSRLCLGAIRLGGLADVFVDALDEVFQAHGLGHKH